MIEPKTIAQVKAFARIDGALLALIWIGSFAITILWPTNIFGQVLALATPFFVGWRLQRFRDGMLEGHISFRRAFVYCLYTFIYASLIFAVAQYIYFRFLDQGRFPSMMVDTLNMLAPIYERNGVPTEQIEEVSKMIMTTSPIEMAFVFMTQNIFIGLILSLVTATIMKRR